MLRTTILWSVHVWRKGAWRNWSGTSGDVRLDGIRRDADAERTQLAEAERIAPQGLPVRLVRLGSTERLWNIVRGVNIHAETQPS